MTALITSNRDRTVTIALSESVPGTETCSLLSQGGDRLLRQGTTWTVVLEDRRRDIPITEDMASVLEKLLAESKCEYVFTNLHDHSAPLSANTLANQHRSLKRSCEYHPDAGIHALRHTFLTEAGRHTQNVRALQKLAGHSKIETTMRYIHPDETDVLEIASAVQRARSKRVTTVFTTVREQQLDDSRKM